MIKKELYAAPETVVLELRFEGVICQSTDLPGGTGYGFEDGGEG